MSEQHYHYFVSETAGDVAKCACGATNRTVSIHPAVPSEPTTPAHEFRFYVDSDGVQLDCVCRYDPSDESRPCWPWETDRDEPEPLPGPQTECTFTDWVDNDGVTCLAAPVEIPLDLIAHSWDSGTLALNLALHGEVGMPSPSRDAVIRAGDHLAHTLRAIYGWWEKGENVLEVNKEWAEEGLAMWADSRSEPSAGSPSPEQIDAAARAICVRSHTSRQAETPCSHCEIAAKAALVAACSVRGATTDAT